MVLLFSFLSSIGKVVHLGQSRLWKPAASLLYQEASVDLENCLDFNGKWLGVSKLEARGQGLVGRGWSVSDSIYLKL